MTGGFQICNQNLNRTTFDSLFGQEMDKNWQNLALANFWPFFGQKQRQVSSDWKFETRFGTLWSFAHPFLLVFSNFDFLSTVIISKFQMELAVISLSN